MSTDVVLTKEEFEEFRRQFQEFDLVSRDMGSRVYRPSWIVPGMLLRRSGETYHKVFGQMIMVVDCMIELPGSSFLGARFGAEWRLNIKALYPDGKIDEIHSRIDGFETRWEIVESG